MSQSRRQFLASAGTGAVAVLASDPALELALARKTKLLRGGSFDEGVLAGDPTPDGITFLTRLNGVEGPGGVRVEVARDRDFRHVVARSVLVTSGAIGHTVKARVSGLKPHTEYWYRFHGRSADSPRGRFRTSLPRDSRQPVRFGVFYGQNFEAGFFNAHDQLAREDLDFVLNLGNYISAGGTLGNPQTAREAPQDQAATTYTEYRRLYRAYRRDPDLRAMHAAHAMVSTWDDGEVAFDYAGRGGFTSDYHVPGAQRGAYRAWFESMPHYPKQRGSSRIYHTRRFGHALEMLVLDTRQYRVDPPCGRDEQAGCVAAGGGEDMLGGGQHKWLRSQLGQSRARWRVVASPAGLATLLDPSGRPTDYSNWAGYPSAQQTLLRYFGDFGVRNSAFISGGARRFLAAELTDPEGLPAPPEFACGTVTAPIFGPANEPQAANGRIRETDPFHHGYVTVTATQDNLDVTFRKMQTVATRSARRSVGSRWRLHAGRNTLTTR